MGQGGAGWGQGLLILIPEETYNTCNFTGGGGGGCPDLLTPTSLWNQENR